MYEIHYTPVTVLALDGHGHARQCSVAAGLQSRSAYQIALRSRIYNHSLDSIKLQTIY